MERQSRFCWPSFSERTSETSSLIPLTDLRRPGCISVSLHHPLTTTISSALYLIIVIFRCTSILLEKSESNRDLLAPDRGFLVDHIKNSTWSAVSCVWLVVPGGFGHWILCATEWCLCNDEVGISDADAPLITLSETNQLHPDHERQQQQ